MKKLVEAMIATGYIVVHLRQIIIHISLVIYELSYESLVYKIAVKRLCLAVFIV